MHQASFTWTALTAVRGGNTIVAPPRGAPCVRCAFIRSAGCRHVEAHEPNWRFCLHPIVQPRYFDCPVLGPPRPVPGQPSRLRLRPHIRRERGSSVLLSRPAHRTRRSAPSAHLQRRCPPRSQDGEPTNRLAPEWRAPQPVSTRRTARGPQPVPARADADASGLPCLRARRWSPHVGLGNLPKNGSEIGGRADG